ncbi:MAG: Serine/threonine-protein kinase PknD [Chlamydiae bacterium]|nr:Serine/threonine-protein kinase PknD [Chlamydiota bacterium]
MGEVFLAHDAVCGRDVALKQMRQEWRENTTMQERFLREARIAAQLSHPSIIPIYSIEESFYTMAHIEGETLKEILKKTKEQSKKGEPLHPIGSSVPALVRIFLSVCGAVGYAHSRGVLHRDLKPENIIVGKFGEVIILDWGLADFIAQPEKNGLDFKEGSPQLTQPGKIPGTLLYMAPERTFGAKSSVQTDIYSLGVMLYQILTLSFPFHRKSVKEFRKMHQHEKILDPEEVAPDREISPHLTSIVLGCLENNPSKRFQKMHQLIRELENYIEGIPEWQEAKQLKLDRKDDWQFQENIALAKHRALMRGLESVEWVNLMISKAQFPGNVLIETKLTIHEGNKGVGFLFSVPEISLPKAIEEAYCLWFSDQGVRLYRSNVEVFHTDQVVLEKERAYRIRITNIDNHIRLFLDGVQKFGFLNVIPLSGTRIGLFLRDGAFTIDSLTVSVGSQNIMVNCLAVPDAFLARKSYDEALQEYRKISHSFPGRAEGREATFRAGLTLLKKAEKHKQKNKRESLFSEALVEFEKLHNTPGGPLEYLGKSFVYKAGGEFQEEAKCLELALRKYPKHPLKPILVENILSRLHESSQSNRQVAYLFALLVLRHLSHLPDAKMIADVLDKHLEPLPFFTPSERGKDNLIIQLAFWLSLPNVLVEMVEKGDLSISDAQNAHVALILLGEEKNADLSILDKECPEITHACFEYSLRKRISLPKQPHPLWTALKEKNWEKAQEILEKLPPKCVQDEENLAFFLYGCFLAGKKGEKEAVAHLTNISERAFPPTSALLSHFLMGRINLKNGWIEKAFSFEKLRLMQELELFSLCLGDEKLQKIIKQHAKKMDS